MASPRPHLEPPVVEATVPRWRVRLLGATEAIANDGTRIDRFGGASVSGLLARLALFPGRSHPREELIDRLWPDASIEVGRNRLRQALFALRALLEPPGAVARPVLIADRDAIRVAEGALGCDVGEFERALREGRHHDAQVLYAGELMPGRYEDWIDEERQRLAALAERAALRATRPPAALPPVPPVPPVPGPGSPPAAARRERSPLPTYLNRMLGRDEDRTHLLAELREHRLVTVVATGGCGKTRLAVAALGAIMAADDGAAAPRDAAAPARLALFVPLVGCTDRAGLLDALAAALRLPAAGGEPLERIVAALDARPASIVLDNFEQLVDLAADVVAELLAALPELTLLVTSRRLLGVEGERPFALQPLALPEGRAALDVAATNPAVALFIDRARSVRADFHLSARNHATLVELVRVLDGLPLAIELAASRVRSVAPAEMLAHLRPTPVLEAGAPPGTGLALLARSTPRSGADPRHASMLRTIEWSWNLLTPALQRLLAELTVFDGGCTAAAVAAVATLADRPTLVALDELVGHSLVRVEPMDAPDAPDLVGLAPGGSVPLATTTRFHLGAPIRDYAAARLDAEAARGVRLRHRRWLVETGQAQAVAPVPAVVRAELRNLQQAVASALADGAPSEAVRVLVAWWRGLPDVAIPAGLHVAGTEALARLDREIALDADLERTALASRGHTLFGRLAVSAGRPEPARVHAARGLELARGVAARSDPGDTAATALLARALHTSASVLWRTARDAPATIALLDEAEPLALAAGDLGVQASVCALRGLLANVARAGAADVDQAARLHRRALMLWESAGDRVAANSGRYNLAVCALRARQPDEVLARLRDVAAEATRQHDWRLLSQALNVEGEARMLLRDMPGAVRAYRASLELGWTVFAQSSFAYALWNLPHPLSRRLDPVTAARLGGAAEHFWRTRIGSFEAGDRRELRRLRRRCAAQIGAGRMEVLWQEGARLPLPDLVEQALGRVPPPEPLPTTPNG